MCKKLKCYTSQIARPYVRPWSVSGPRPMPCVSSQWKPIRSERKRWRNSSRGRYSTLSFQLAAILAARMQTADWWTPKHCLHSVAKRQRKWKKKKHACKNVLLAHNRQRRILKIHWCIHRWNYCWVMRGRSKYAWT